MNLLCVWILKYFILLMIYVGLALLQRIWYFDWLGTWHQVWQMKHWDYKHTTKAPLFSYVTQIIQVIDLKSNGCWRGQIMHRILCKSQNPTCEFKKWYSRIFSRIFRLTESSYINRWTFISESISKLNQDYGWSFKHHAFMHMRFVYRP